MRLADCVYDRLQAGGLVRSEGDLAIRFEGFAQHIARGTLLAQLDQSAVREPAQQARRIGKLLEQGAGRNFARRGDLAQQGGLLWSSCEKRRGRHLDIHPRRHVRVLNRRNSSGRRAQQGSSSHQPISLECFESLGLAEFAEVAARAGLPVQCFEQRPIGFGDGSGGERSPSMTGDRVTCSRARCRAGG